MGKSTPKEHGFLVVGSRLVPAGDVLGLSDLAKHLGVTKRTAANYVNRPDFPSPLATLDRGRVWAREDVERWAKATLPLQTGRPRKPSENG